jgi:hypothetical protein
MHLQYCRICDGKSIKIITIPILQLSLDPIAKSVVNKPKTKSNSQCVLENKKNKRFDTR